MDASNTPVVAAPAPAPTATVAETVAAGTIKSPVGTPVTPPKPEFPCPQCNRTLTEFPCHKCFFPFQNSFGDEEWGCVSCGVENPLINTVCEECGLHRYVQPSEVDSDEEEEEEGEFPVAREILSVASVGTGKFNSFWVWAPNAKSVSVVGDFNEWNEKANPLSRDIDQETWRGLVNGVQPGHAYCFHISWEETQTTIKWERKQEDGSYQVQEQCDELNQAFGNGDSGLLGEIEQGSVRRTEETSTNQCSALRADPRSLILKRDERNKDGYVSVVYDHLAYQWKHSGFENAPPNERVAYQIHIDSIDMKTGGTFAMAQKHIPRIAKMGFNVICLLPITEDLHPCGETAMCWGYDPMSLFAVHHTFGTPDELKVFVDCAHEHGMAVVFDLVPNHMSVGSALANFDGADCYFYHDERVHTDFGPRPNYDSMQVRRYVLDSVVSFIRNFQMDGVRVDSTSNIRMLKGHNGDNKQIASGFTLMQDMNTLVHTTMPGKFTIAEDLEDHFKVLNSRGGGFDLQWDEDYFKCVIGALTTTNDSDRDMNSLVFAVNNSFSGEECGRLLYIENHDTVPEDRHGRIPAAVLRGVLHKWAEPEQVEQNSLAIRRTLVGLTFLLTTPGLPMVMQGQEVFEIFAPAWPIGPAVDWTRAERMSPPGGIAAVVETLVGLRRNIGDLTGGLCGRGRYVYHVNHKDKVMAFHRWDKGGDDVIVLLNLSRRTFDEYWFGVPRLGNWHVRFNTEDTRWFSDAKETGFKKATARSVGGHHGFPFSLSAKLAPYSAVVLSQSPVAFVSFCAEHPHLKEGQRLVVVGSTKLLGKWKPQHAKTLAVDTEEGNVYRSECIQMEAGTSFEFKLLVISKDKHTWESGVNQTYVTRIGTQVVDCDCRFEPTTPS